MVQSFLYDNLGSVEEAIDSTKALEVNPEYFDAISI